jgi:hypothetical protein
VSDYDNYNTHGTVTRDTWDWSNMPEFLRLDRIRGRSNGRTIAILFDDEEKADIVRLKKRRLSLVAIGERYGVSDKVIKRVILEAQKNERDRDTTTDSKDATGAGYILPQRSQRGGWRGK